MDHTIHISRFRRGAQDTTPVEGDLTWARLYQHLTTPRVAGNGKMSVPGISFARYGPVKYRANKNVVEMAALTYDVDNQEVPVQLHPEDFEVPWAHAWYTTYSSTVKHVRWRLVVLLLQPVSPSVYAVLYQQVAEYLGIAEWVDRSCTDPSRMFFEFQSPHIEQAQAGGNPDGPWLDPGALGPRVAETPGSREAQSFNNFTGFTEEPMPMEEIEQMLSDLDPDDLAESEQQWSTFMLGLADHARKTARVAEIRSRLDQWNRTSSKYNGREIEQLFKRQPDPGAPRVTLGTSLWLASSVGDYARPEGDWPEAIDPEAPGVPGLPRFQVTQDITRSIQKTRFIYQQMIAKGHLTIVVGEPGAGKTTIMEHVASEIAADRSMEVNYLNVDVGGGDVIDKFSLARAGGWLLLCPDLIPGESVRSVVRVLREELASSADLSNKVLIVDTLKKACEVINKKSARGFLQLLRQLTTRGMTVICVAHTNKYRDADGFPIYEGTGDIRSDTDQLVLLSGRKTGADRLVTSLYWQDQGWGSAKSRCRVAPLTWEALRRIGPDGEEALPVVQLLEEWVDVLQVEREEKEKGQEDRILETISGVLEGHSEGLSATELETQVTSRGVVRKAFREALRTGLDLLWICEKGPGPRKSYRLLDT